MTKWTLETLGPNVAIREGCYPLTTLRYFEVWRVNDNGDALYIMGAGATKEAAIKDAARCTRATPMTPRPQVNQQLLRWLNHLLCERVKKNHYFRAVVQDWMRQPRGHWAWSVDRFLESCGAFYCHGCGLNRLGEVATKCSSCRAQEPAALPPVPGKWGW